MPKTAVAFRHMIDNDLGTLQSVLEKRGVSVKQIDTFDETLEGFDPFAPDLLIVLGGAPGVYQGNHYPFLDAELAIIKTRLKADRPTLGICLGAQLMAAALGASVFKGSQGSEVGWLPLDVNADGQKTPVRHFDAGLTRVMQWHGDTFDFPDGAILLASTAKYPNQVFQVGRNGMAFQCHIEVTRKTVRSWYVLEAYSVAEGSFDLHRVQNDTEKFAGQMAAQTEKFFNEWLDQVGV